MTLVIMDVIEAAQACAVRELCSSGTVRLP